MSTLAIQLQPFALSGPPPAQAPLLWDWSYNGNGFAAGGTLITSGTQDSNGYYQISGVTGARNGDPIVALEPTGEAIPGNAGYPVDNLINAGGQLTASGFGYETAG